MKKYLKAAKVLMLSMVCMATMVMYSSTTVHAKTITKKPLKLLSEKDYIDYMGNYQFSDTKLKVSSGNTYKIPIKIKKTGKLSIYWETEKTGSVSFSIKTKSGKCVKPVANYKINHYYDKYTMNEVMLDLKKGDYYLEIKCKKSDKITMTSYFFASQKSIKRISVKPDISLINFMDETKLYKKGDTISYKFTVGQKGTYNVLSGYQKYYAFANEASKRYRMNVYDSKGKKVTTKKNAYAYVLKPGTYTATYKVKKTGLYGSVISNPTSGNKVLSLAIGETYKVTPQKGASKFKFRSTDPSIATINKDGTITAKREGSTTIEIEGTFFKKGTSYSSFQVYVMDPEFIE